MNTSTSHRKLFISLWSSSRDFCSLSFSCLLSESSDFRDAFSWFRRSHVSEDLFCSSERVLCKSLTIDFSCWSLYSSNSTRIRKHCNSYLYYRDLDNMASLTLIQIRGKKTEAVLKCSCLKNSSLFKHERNQKNAQTLWFYHCDIL